VLYRTFGQTGKNCSVLGFGGMRFENVHDRDACVAMMVEAARGGVNYFDTAPAYFGIESEKVFGEGFRELRRLGLPYFCATKTTEKTEKGIRKEIHAQLARLGLERIDFYHVWCILTPEEWADRKQRGAWATFQKLKDEGLIGHICVSSHLIGDEIRALLEVDPFEGVLFGYSAYNFSAREKAFEAIRERSLGCVVMNPLGGGLIPQNPDVFSFIKSRPDQGIVEAALHFLWSHPEITTALVGFSSLREVREGLAAVSSFRAVDPAYIEQVRGAIGDAFLHLCTGCQYCNHCPEGIPVPQLMDAYNHLHLAGTEKAVKDRLKWHWNLPASEAGRCNECGDCESACTQHLPIVERLKAIARLGR
jgi:predicted aldo/keto reductase-like oxidoreductase